MSSPHQIVMWKNDSILHSFKNVRSIQIERMDYCNRKCAWCPNSTRKQSKDNVMSFDTYAHILDQLKGLGYTGRIHPYLNGEPLCDDNLCDFIAYTRRIFPDNVIFISTNGDLLTVDLARRLFESGLSSMAVMDYDELGKSDTFAAWPGIEVVRKQHIDWWYNRGGKVAVPCTTAKDYCEWVFQKMYINYRGQAVLCCSDFHSTVIMGDVLKTPLLDVWQSDIYKQYRVAHFTKKGKTMALCAECNRLGG